MNTFKCINEYKFETNRPDVCLQNWSIDDVIEGAMTSIVFAGWTSRAKCFAIIVATLVWFAYVEYKNSFRLCINNK